jgi:hypothetical protein
VNATGKGDYQGARARGQQIEFVKVDAVGAARNAEKKALLSQTLSGSLNERRVGRELVCSLSHRYCATTESIKGVKL